MIVVTAPTGNIGRQVVAGLLARDAPVRVIVRDPAKLAEDVRARVEVVVGSHREADVVDKAFAGADAVFWLAPSDPRATDVLESYVDFTRPAAAALVDQGVGRVVGVSALGRGSAVVEQSGYVAGSLAMDALIAGTGVPFRALLNPSFMDNTLRQLDAIRNQGAIFAPTHPELKAPTCATRDIAGAAVGLLLDDTWTGYEGVPVLGPEDLSGDDLARIMSEVLGRTIRYQQIPADAVKAQMLEFGVSEAMAQGFADMAVAKDNGLDNAEPRTPLATTPTTFRQWCEDVLKPAVLA